MNILDYARELIVLNDGSYLELMYPDDLRRIIKICRDRGLEITPEIAQRFLAITLCPVASSVTSSCVKGM